MRILMNEDSMTLQGINFKGVLYTYAAGNW